MGPDAISSALRLELRPGEWVLWDERPHRFDSLDKDRARIRDAATSELREVSVAVLRALPYLPNAELDARMENLRTIDPKDCVDVIRSRRIRHSSDKGYNFLECA